MVQAPDLPGRSAATLGAVLAFHARRAPEAPALTFEGRTTSYSDLLARAAATAQALREAGLGRGDRIAYLGKNNDAYFVLLYAAATLGLVLTPLNWRLAENEWAFIVEDAGVACIFADATFDDAADRLAARTPELQRWPLPSMDGPVSGNRALPDSADPDDVVLQIYTSGTTGRPKGAMLTHRNLLALRAPGY